MLCTYDLWVGSLSRHTCYDTESRNTRFFSERAPPHPFISLVASGAKSNGVFPLSQHFEKIQGNLCWLGGKGA